MPVPTALSPDALLAALQTRYPDLVEARTWGERALFYNPGAALPHGVYFVTLKLHDSANDAASRLDARGAYRLNLGLTPAGYAARFSARPPRPAKGGVVATGHDFTVLDTLTPHPIYAWMGWAAILSPSAASLEALRPELDASYAAVQRKFRRRLPSRPMAAAAASAAR
jgi:hypothetical protein